MGALLGQLEGPSQHILRVTSHRRGLLLDHNVAVCFFGLLGIKRRRLLLGLLLMEDDRRLVVRRSLLQMLRLLRDQVILRGKVVVLEPVD